MTQAFILSGALIEWSTDEGANFAEIPEAKMVALPDVDVDYKDVTSLQSPGGFKEYITGLFDGGSFDLECNYTPGIFGQATAMRNSRAPVRFRVALPVQPGQSTADVFEYDALVNPKLPSGAAEDTAMLTLVLKMTGQPQYTEGAAA